MGGRGGEGRGERLREPGGSIYLEKEGDRDEGNVCLFQITKD